MVLGASSTHRRAPAVLGQADTIMAIRMKGEVNICVCLDQSALYGECDRRRSGTRGKGHRSGLVQTALLGLKCTIRSKFLVASQWLVMMVGIIMIHSPWR